VQRRGRHPGDDRTRFRPTQLQRQGGRVHLTGDDEYVAGPVPLGPGPGGLYVATIRLKPSGRGVKQPDPIRSFHGDHRPAKILRLGLDYDWPPRPERGRSGCPVGEIVP